ncbi:hypothetical protein BC833DRAFT_612074 [Globomyces pollinis-pini]|nr:hypothetical protein BC833DRAFT_612074 [Globomyces pollinis-pini]
MNWIIFLSTLVTNSIAAVLSGTINSPIQLASSTQIQLNGGSHKLFLTESGNFDFQLSDGTYLLEILSLDIHFERYRVEVKDDIVKAFDFPLGSSLDVYGEELELPLQIYAQGSLSYFTPRDGFSVMGLFANPMTLISIALVFFMFVMPKIKDFMMTEEMQKEYEQEKQKRAVEPANAPIAMPDISAGLADWFVPKEEKKPAVPAPAAPATSSTKSSGKSKKRK